MHPNKGLETRFECGGVEIELDPAASLWIWINKEMQQRNSNLFQLLEVAIVDIYRNGKRLPAYRGGLSKEDTTAVVDKILWFGRGGKPLPEQSGKAGPRIIDYDEDFDALYAAFQQVYSIDLMAHVGGKTMLATMHWWRFLALANHLPAGNVLTDYYMHYRGIDLSKLPSKTDADKKYKAQIAEIKKKVALDKPKASSKAKKEPSFISSIRERRAIAMEEKG